VFREDSERIYSVLRFDGNKPVSVLHKSVGPLQYHKRCMLSDCSSDKWTLKKNDNKPDDL
jgi:hypothetical protein